jgi:hypothetical protein
MQVIVAVTASIGVLGEKTVIPELMEVIDLLQSGFEIA